MDTPKSIFTEPEIIPFEERIKTAKTTPDGLYPPEVIAIFFCKRHSDPNKIPNYYWCQYGIENVPKLQQSLSERGFIMRDQDQNWTPTDNGKKSLELNGDIVYVHRHPHSMADVWSIQEEPIPNNGTWRDRLWGYWNKQSLFYAKTLDFINVALIRLAQGEFLEKEEKKYEHALETYRQAKKDFQQGMDIALRIMWKEKTKYLKEHNGNDSGWEWHWCSLQDVPENIRVAMQFDDIPPAYDENIERLERKLAQ